MVPALEGHPVKKVELRHTQTKQTQHSIEAGEQTSRSPNWGHTQLWTDRRKWLTTCPGGILPPFPFCAE